jgi:sugar O-acyltransferase (sialic acid O-acetyltransferase NeuD family)
LAIVPSNIHVQENSIAIAAWDEGGAGQVHSWLEQQGRYHIACFVNVSDEPVQVDIEAERKKRPARQFDYPERESFKGRPLISSLQWLDVIRDLGISKALVMCPDRHQRLQQIREADRRGIELVSAIHPTALILEDAILHENLIIFARAVIGYRTELYPGVTVNTGSIIEHHNVVRSCAIIDPGVRTAGNVLIGECAHIHTGATIIPKIRIGDNAIVGAGSVVIRDVPGNVTVAGNPARIIREHQQP